MKLSDEQLLIAELEKGREAFIAKLEDVERRFLEKQKQQSYKLNSHVGNTKREPAQEFGLFINSVR